MKKNLIFGGCLLFLFLFFGFHRLLLAASQIKINEAAPSETSSSSPVPYDWIEFYNDSGGNVDLTNWTVEARVSAGSNPIKTFPAFTFTNGTYIVLHCSGSATNDETAADTNANGYRDFYTGPTVTGLTATDNVVVIKNAGGTIIDCLAFTNGDGSWGAAAADNTRWDNAATAGQWVVRPVGSEQTEAASSGGTTIAAGKSYARDDVSTDNDNVSSKSDWSVQSLSPGAQNSSGGGGGGSGGDIKAVITELDPGQSSTGAGDAVELYVLESTANIGGCTLVASGGGTVTFPTVAVSSGDYIIVHFLAGTNSASANVNSYGNRQWDFYYGSAVSLTSTDNNITLKNSAGTIVDFVSYADDSATYSATKANYDAAVTGGQWTPAATSDAEYIAGSVSSVGVSTTKTLNRAVDTTGVPVDTNLKNDWSLSDRSLGTLGTSGTTGGTGVIKGEITEVAPNISGGDFVEIFITAACTDVTGVKIYEGTTLIKTLPSGMGTIAKDTFIVLWASQKKDSTHVDETSADENGNGYIDLYSDESSPGLTGTDNNITLKNADGTIVDFMSFANSDTSYTGSTSGYDAAVAANQWSPDATNAAAYIAGSFAWSGSTSKSMYRLATAGVPTDTNAKSDWSESSTTPGYGDYGGIPISTVKTLEIFQSPFSPYGDGTYRQAKIAFNVPANNQITMRVFDVSGRQVRILLDHTDGGGASATVNWDGKDDNGSIVRTGVYIVNIEALNKTTGSAKTSSKRVVVGRKM